MPYGHLVVVHDGVTEALEKANGLFAFPFKQQREFIYCDRYAPLFLPLSQYLSVLRSTLCAVSLPVALWGESLTAQGCVQSLTGVNREL